MYMIEYDVKCELFRPVVVEPRLLFGDLERVKI